MDLVQGMYLEGGWTDEKHSHLLNWMEVSFVRRMHDQSHHHPLLNYATLDDTCSASTSYYRTQTRNGDDGNDAQANSRNEGRSRTKDARKNRKKRKELLLGRTVIKIRWSLSDRA